MSETQEPTVTLEGITKDYAGLRALTDVSVTIGPGVTGLLGPNGAGKSTLIKAILGLVRISRGKGRVFGLDVGRDSRRIRERVGYMPEDDCYLAGLSGVQMVRFSGRLSGLPSVEALRRAHEILDYAGVREERYREVQTYSTGMRQKLKFAQAITHHPEFLILDEPTAGLDPEERRRMLERIHSLGTKSGMTVLLSTHILHDVQEVSSAVVILDKGRVLLSERIEVVNRPKEPSYSFRAHGDSGPLVERIRSAGMRTESGENGAIVVRGVDDAFPRRIFGWAAELGVGIRNLEPGRNSLEEVFLETVKGGSSARV